MKTHDERFKSCELKENRDTKTRIELQLSAPAVDWTYLAHLLQNLQVSNANDSRCSLEDDPMGRLLLGRVLSRDPPISTLRAMLRAFPDCLHNNPAAFFIASQYNVSKETLAFMMHHALVCSNPDELECPYPWIVSDIISVSAVQALLEVYPKGVLQTSSFLSGHCLLDYFLRSTDIMQSKALSVKLWCKLKLVLVAAEYSYVPTHNFSHASLAPAHVVLKRMLSFPDFFDNTALARHCIWILHQLCSHDRWIFQKSDASGTYPLQLVLGQKCQAKGHEGRVIARELVKLLLHADPKSASFRVRDRLAIHMAVENNWPCHDLLLAVHPEALNVTDTKSDLLPFQAAASVEDLNSGLDVTFELLRANPNHIKLAGVSARA